MHETSVENGDDQKCGKHEFKLFLKPWQSGHVEITSKTRDRRSKIAKHVRTEHNGVEYQANSRWEWVSALNT